MDIETVAEEVAVETVRSFSPILTLVGGLIIGAAVGFYYGKRWNTEKIQAQAFEESQAEVEKIREVYMQKAVVSEPKPSVDEVIREKGYSSVQRALSPPVPIQNELVKDGDWDYATEIQNRNPSNPYVIHQDEHSEGREGYSQVTYTYWALDDVLCDESERPLPHADLIVGQTNLKFGYGTDDSDVVFVRNETLQIDMEICRTHRSYEQDVLGLQDDEGS